MIRLHRVEKRYGREAMALQNISCSLGRGEVAFLLGPSGAGKTTLLRLLLGQEQPTAGEVVVLGQNVAELSRTQVRYLRRRMGLVLRDSLLLPELNVEENVALPLRIAGLRTRLVRQRTGGILERLGLCRQAQRLPRTLSAGEAQRVAIARALVSHPLLVLADEPTGNLDRSQAREVMSLLVSLVEEGMALLVATHDEELLAPQARILRLENGRLHQETKWGQS